MEHKRKKQWILIMLLLTVCSVFVVYAGREWMFAILLNLYTFLQYPMHPEMGMDVLCD